VILKKEMLLKQGYILFISIINQEMENVNMIDLLYAHITKEKILNLAVARQGQIDHIILMILSIHRMDVLQEGQGEKVCDTKLQTGGKKVYSFALRNQIKKYSGFGQPDGSTHNVYYLGIVE